MHCPILERVLKNPSRFATNHNQSQPVTTKHVPIPRHYWIDCPPPQILLRRPKQMSKETQPHTGHDGNKSYLQSFRSDVPDRPPYWSSEFFYEVAGFTAGITYRPPREKICAHKYCPCPLILSGTVIPRAGTLSLRPTTPTRTIARNYLASHQSVESIHFLWNLRAGGEETRGRETAQPNNYHSISLAAGPIVAQGPPFSGFLNIFSWIFGRTRLMVEIGLSQGLYPHCRRRNAWCSTQTYVHANRHTSPRCTRRPIPFEGLQYSKALAAPTVTIA
jgi:hypothetical protein